MSDLTDEYHETLDSLIGVQARLSDLKQFEDELKARLRQLGQGDYPFPGGSLKLTQATKFDAVAATAALTPAQIAECAKTVLDPAKVKEHLTTAEIRQYSKPDGVLRVSVKVE